MFVRFEGLEKSSKGHGIGVFGLANRLAHSGALSIEDYAWWRTNNDWMNRAYPDPSSKDDSIFNREVHPRVECWFKISNTTEDVLRRTREYLTLLDRYGIVWVERQSSAPGPILYEDDFQIVIDAAPADC